MPVASLWHRRPQWAHWVSSGATRFQSEISSPQPRQNPKRSRFGKAPASSLLRKAALNTECSGLGTKNGCNRGNISPSRFPNLAADCHADLPRRILHIHFDGNAGSNGKPVLRRWLVLQILTGEHARHKRDSCIEVSYPTSYRILEYRFFSHPGKFHMDFLTPICSI